MPVSTKKAKIELGFVLISFLLVIAMVWPFLGRGIPASHDVLAHTTRAKLMLEAIREGQLPVRWVGWVFEGQGAPLFQYYQPGFYYGVSLVTLLVGKISTGFKMSVVGWWILGAVGMYLVFAKKGRLAGAAGMLAYMLSQYVVSDLVVRGSMPELAALMLLPWIWWSTEQALSGKRWGGPVLALTVGLAAVMHLPTFGVGMVFVAGAAWLGRGQVKTRWSDVGRVLWGWGLGLGLAAFYWLPALVEWSSIQHEWLAYGAYDFRAHFVTLGQMLIPSWGTGISTVGEDDGMSFFIGGLAWLGLVLGGVAVWRGRKWARGLFVGKIEQERKPIYWGLMAGAAGGFLMHPVSRAFWEGYGPMQWWQYPWRMGMLVAMGSCLAMGGAVAGLRRKYAWWVGAAVIAVGAAMGWVGRPAERVEDNVWGINEVWSHGEMRMVDVEEGYLPRGAVASKAGVLAAPVEVVAGEARVVGLVEKADEIRFEIEAGERSVVEVRRFFFPGWIVEEQEGRPDGGVGEFRKESRYLGEVAGASESGRVSFEVDEGVHEIRVRLARTPVRAGAKVVSGLSLVLLVGWVGCERRIRLVK